MEKQYILNFCKKNGFFLNKEILNLFIKLKNKDIIKIINDLKKKGFSNNILTKEIFNKYKLNINFNKNNINFNILEDIKRKPNKIDIQDFINYFINRFEKLKDILIKKNFEKLISIRKIRNNNGIFWVIGMIYSKKTTKNNNLLIEIEDLTGSTIILVNKENKQLFKQANSLLLDDIIAFKVSGSSKMLFLSDIVFPNSYLNNEKNGNKDEFVAFGGDFYVGSKNFLEKNLMKFIDWLNGIIGDDRQKKLAKKIKYLILTGNNIEGIGIYNGQEKFLKIKKCRDQYNKLFEILKKIRKDIKIIMIPGKHDAVWDGKPQPSINKKWSCNLNNLNNLKLISNPSMIEIEGLKFLIYNNNLNKFIDIIDEKNNPLKIIEEILKRRHLAPIYGEMNIIPDKMKDNLIISELPDVFVLGGQCNTAVGNYNNILTISNSCWKSKNNHYLKNKSSIDFCKVPILNLKNKKIKILDFSEKILDNCIKWEESEDLFCKVGSHKRKKEINNE